MTNNKWCSRKIITFVFKCVDIIIMCCCGEESNGADILQPLLVYAIEAACVEKIIIEKTKATIL